METIYYKRPRLSRPSMVAVWPGMGHLAKMAGDYLRRRLNAKIFAEIRYYQNAVIYVNGLAELSYVRHRLYASPKHDLIICVGEAQPSIPEMAYRLARQIIRVAEKFNVRRIYTLAAYPNDYQDTPGVYGIYTDECLRGLLLKQDIRLLEGEGAINGLNGILIGVAKNRGIEGICLMAEIKYTNLPQHFSSKVVLDKLASLLGISVDTSYLMKRAERFETLMRRRLSMRQECEEYIKVDEKNLRYIS
ncbi:MAG: PAC2 family protein [Candidatus Bathyarchaeia archaeon]|nr:PAC2 family protein [Candidatus Bathyarchaeota archaeon]